ncbi:nuclear pore complex component-domain-containing protein [Dipodascopsis tothii]|uniref:nuclear pore complex component-domain-containing protein n=1 Tax=Dipodascopsis tothii TaxID=44089 RepID=UPI0034CD6D2B
MMCPGDPPRERPQNFCGGRYETSRTNDAAIAAALPRLESDHMASSPFTPQPQGGSPRSPQAASSPVPYSQSPFKSLFTGPDAGSPLARDRRDDRGPTTPATPADVPTGSWKHPSLDAVQRRGAAREFTQATSRRMVLNAVSWIAFHVGSRALASLAWMQELYAANEIFSRNLHYAGVALQMLFLWNIIDGLIKLARPQDRFEDLPLTPSQRKLLGLNPDVVPSKPVTPMTPPKYVKTSPQARSSPRASPLLKKKPLPTELGGTPVRTPVAAIKATPSSDKRSSPLAGSPLAGTPLASSGLTPSGRYLYMTDSPLSSPSVRRKR